MNLRSIIVLISVILFSTSVVATDFLTVFNPFTGNLDYYTLDGGSSSNTSLDSLNVTDLLVINAPVECPAGTYMTYTNMSESVCESVADTNLTDIDVLYYANGGCIWHNGTSLRIENVCTI